MRRRKIGVLLFFIVVSVPTESLSVHDKRVRVLECLLEFATDQRKESCANLGEKGNSPSEILELQLSTLENGVDAGKIVKIETLLPKIEKEEGSGSVLEPTTTNLDKIKDDITKLKYQLHLLENDLEEITQESSPK